jgi:hypothetical protein
MVKATIPGMRRGLYLSKPIGGRLVEEGSAGELLARDGLFARLYRIQQESLGWGVGSIQ